MHVELTKLKLLLIRQNDMVFFTSLLLSLDVHEDNNVPTAATDGTSVKVNKEFFLSLSTDERIFLLLHEVMHVALSHMTRLGNRNPRKFNAACDYAVNYDLVQAGYKMPKDGLYSTDYADLTAEQIYDLLPDSEEYDENDLIYGDSDELKQSIEDTLLRADASAKQSGDKAIGSIPGSAQRVIDELLDPYVPWQTLLQDHMTDHSTDDYSMAFPDEEYMPNLYVPTLYSDGMGDMSIFCDVSGSVSHRDLIIAVTEINSLIQGLKPRKTTLVSFDTEIRLETTYSKDEIADLAGIDMHGGGGTSVKDVYKHIRTNLPELALIITDGWYSEISLKSPTDVIYLILDNPKFSTSNGRVIHIRTEDYINGNGKKKCA